MTGDTRRLIWVSAAMAVAGMVLAEGGASLGVMTDHFALNGTTQGILVSTRFLGGVIMGLVLWIDGGRSISVPRAMTAALVLVLVTAPLLLIDRYGAALIVASARGLAAGIIIPASGIFASSQSTYRPGLVAVVANAGLSVGLVAITAAAGLLGAGAAAGAATGASPDWRVYWLPTAIVGLVAALVRLVAEPPAVAARAIADAHRTAAPVAPAGALARLFATMRATRWRYTVGSTLLVSSEAVLFGFLPYLTALRWPTVTPGLSERYALLIMVGVLVGRFAAIPLFARFAAARVLAAFGVIVVGAAVAWAALPAGVLAAVVFTAGIATAGLFPGLVAVVSERLGAGSAPTIASAGWAGGVGGTIGPAIAGIALEAGLPLVAMSSFVAVPGAAAVLLVIAGRRTRATSHM